MQFTFDEKVNSSIRKSIRAAVRIYRQQRVAALQAGTHQPPPSFEMFIGLVESLIDTDKEKELNRLRSPDMRELFEKTWSQRLRSYTVQQELHESYDALLRRFKRE